MNRQAPSDDTMGASSGAFGGFTRALQYLTGDALGSFFNRLRHNAEFKLRVVGSIRCA